MALLERRATRDALAQFDSSPVCVAAASIFFRRRRLRWSWTKSGRHTQHANSNAAIPRNSTWTRVS